MFSPIFLLLALLCSVLFDVAYFIRSFICTLVYLITGYFSNRSFFEEIDIYGICLTTDLDNMLHMNNSRYLRECDFARMKFYLVTRLWQSIQKCGGTMLNGGNCIRYRKSVEFLDVFFIRSKLIYWDTKSFYVEQHLTRWKDNFICAVIITRMAVKNASPSDILKHAAGREVPSPPVPQDLQKLIESWEASSQKLRKTH